MGWRLLDKKMSSESLTFTEIRFKKEEQEIFIEIILQLIPQLNLSSDEFEIIVHKTNSYSYEFKKFPRGDRETGGQKTLEFSEYFSFQKKCRWRRVIVELLPVTIHSHHTTNTVERDGWLFYFS